MTIKKGEFIKIEYTGTLETGAVFDTTSEEVAKTAGIHDKTKSYGSIVICVGESQIVDGLDSSFDGKEIGTEFKIEVSPEQGFGKKNPQLIRLIPTKRFQKEGINPVPNMSVFVDGQMGFVKTVSGGRTLVDFNHPLSGKSLHYTATALEAVTEPKIQLESLAKLQFKAADARLEGGKATLVVGQEVPPQIAEMAQKHIKRLIPSIVSVTFEKK